MRKVISKNGQIAKNDDRPSSFDCAMQRDTRRKFYGFILLALCLTLSSCSSFSRKDVMRNVAIGVAGGFAAGALSRSENKAEWGLLFGGAGGTGAAVATALFADDSVEEQNKKLIEEKEALEEKLRVFDHGTPAANSHSKKTKGIVGYSAEVPEAVKDMVSLGEWQHEAYENNWVKKDENRYEKVCEAVTVVPPGMIGQ